MATYPVINKNTGEQKDVVMSVHEWSQWCADNPDWQRDWSDPSTCPALVKSVNGKINFVKNTLVGMTFLPKSIKPQVLTLRRSKYARKEKKE